MRFTAHNILLPDGSRTIQDKPLLCDEEQCKAFLRTIKAGFPDRSPQTIRIVDLGCLEGGYSVEFARHGYEVLGIEVREENFANCQYVAEKLQLANLRFVCDDVRNVEKYGMFDVIFCCGLLYHLDAPVSYLQTLGRISRRMLILHTHYAQAKSAERCTPSRDKELSAHVFTRMALRVIANKCMRFFKSGKTSYGLSRLTRHEGKQGRWYYEFLPNESTAKVNRMLLTSHGNYRSFWLTKKALVQSIRESGYDLIYEQYDFLDDIVKDTYIEDLSRSLFIGIKT